MRRRRTFGLAAAGAAAALMLAACSSGGSSSTSTGGSGSGSGSGSTAAYNSGITGIVNPSTHKGGTLTFDWRSAPDSFDPGNTYYASVWDFARYYSQALMTYKNCPGACGRTLVPGLATAPGQVSDNGLTWTYHLKSGVKFQDGTPVTSQDVKYAVERTFDRGVLTNGPSYFANLLGGNAATYPGPYKDRSKNLMGLTAVTTPDSSTVVFHLKAPFSDFDYVLTIPQSAPVPPSKDTGASYQTHIDSTGPYEFQSYQLNKTAVLVPNPNWNASEDPTVSQLPSKIVVNMNMNPNDVDNRLLAGDAQVDFAGTGVQAAARAKILSNPALKANSDDPVTGFGWFFYIDSQVAPFTNLACRQAIEYATNHLTLQNAYGGPVAGGAIGSTSLPPTVAGYKSFDLYEATTKTQGDPVKAKAMLKACGQPNGFSTGIAYRSDRPTETQGAQALQQALSAVGIKTTLHGYPTSTYFSNFAGVPKYMSSHNIGIAFGGWGADWPDGYGFLDELVAGNTIVPAGNTNIGMLNDPVVNNLFTKAAGITDVTQRNAIWGQIDQQVMKDAVIVPIVYAKALIYRPTSLTNVYFDQAYQLNNYAVEGVTG
jgi:peptide/nickel transport system substrate-binding protein